jgi:hypothetical protein
MNQQIKNFGRNIRFSPQYYYEPEDVHEILNILKKHCNDQIKAIGSLHSWSDVASGNSVIVNPKKINHVSLLEKENKVIASIGGGAVLKDVMDKIEPYTLPTHGAVYEQTMTGAISTGTHGSGNTSMSDTIEEITLASYDNNGKPKLFCLKEGEKLEAARCSLGCMGIITEVKVKCIPEYYVEDSLQPMHSIEEIKKAEKDFPLQQFLFLPYSWKYYSFKRRKVDKPSTFIARSLYRSFGYLGNDVLFHAMLVFYNNTLKRDSSIIKAFEKTVPKMLNASWKVADRSKEVLALHHELYRHIEMELFVPPKYLSEVVYDVKGIIEFFAGRTKDFPRDLHEKIHNAGMDVDIQKLQGSYVHHYPLFFRKILPDKRTMLSMTGKKNEHRYSMSFFTYTKSQQQAFFRMADFIANLLFHTYDVIPHWGKYFPLKAADIRKHYPQLKRFKEICNELDPNGVFVNDYTKRVLFYGGSHF